tara:strand:- start:913 stop:1215 length:303 start_codon:yes stop_codon:yes gene_type:complete
MNSRREAIKGLISLGVIPLMPFHLKEMEKKMLPIAIVENREFTHRVNIKEYGLLALDYLDDFIDIHKSEILEAAFILLALMLILSMGLIPTKSLVLYLIT